MRDQEVRRIVVIGNSCGGKTRMSRALAQVYGLPLTHVDSIQFLPGMKIRPHAESIEFLRNVQRQDFWVIDGYGPLDILEDRLDLATHILFIDFPLWRHLWWCTRRHIKNLWSRREELPQGCSERSWSHIKKTYKSILQVDSKMKPEMLRILHRDKYRNKIFVIRQISEWSQVAQKGLASFL